MLWFKSQNFGNKARLKKAIPWILNLEDEIDYIVIEGGGPLRKLWDAQLEKRNISVMNIMAEDWRKDLLLDREQRKGKNAKAYAIRYAENYLTKTALKKTSELNVNAAEAILIGIWAMKKLGWINNIQHLIR
jgi:hypothetical protein